MEELLLINPRRRKATTRKRATTAKRRVVRRRPATVACNPAPRRRIRARKSATPVRVARRKYKRNPDSRFNIKETAIPALQGAAGGLALDFIMGLSIIPASLKTGPMKHLIKAGAAMGIGILAKQFLGGAVATNMARGALIVAFHDGIKEVAMTAGVKLNGVGYYPATSGQLGAYPGNRNKAQRLPDISGN